MQIGLSQYFPSAEGLAQSRPTARLLGVKSQLPRSWGQSVSAEAGISLSTSLKQQQSRGSPTTALVKIP